MFSHQHSREPTKVELLRLTGFNPQTLARLQSAAALWEVDLDASPEDGSASLMETLSTQGEGNATEYSAQAQAERELARAVTALPREQALAIQMLYGLNQHGPMRAKEVSVCQWQQQPSLKQHLCLVKELPNVSMVLAADRSAAWSLSIQAQ